MPGGDVNPYLALAGMLAAGLHGIEEKLDLPPEFVGNAYDSDRQARAPHAAGGAGPVRRIRTGPRRAFGDDVVDHYVHAADTELAAFDAAVTDWELRRGFERL